jgi:hypothetical protein
MDRNNINKENQDMKLFIEMTSPHRSVLVLQATELLECKPMGGTYNASNNTYSGELRVRDIPYEHVGIGVADLILKAEDLTGIANYETFKEKLCNIFPPDSDLIKRDGIIIGKIVQSPHVVPLQFPAQEMTVESSKSFIVPEAEAQGLPETPVIEDAVVTEIKPTREPEPIKALTPSVDVKPPVNQPVSQQHLSKAQRRKLKKGLQRQQEQAAAQVKTEKIVHSTPPPAPVIAPVVTPSSAPKLIAKVEPKVEAKYDPGYILASPVNHPDGYFIGHMFVNKDKQYELIIVSSPKERDKSGNEIPDSSKPIIFKDNAVAREVYEALYTHPLASKKIGPAIVRPIEEIDESCRDFEAALVTNALTFINTMIASESTGVPH